MKKKLLYIILGLILVASAFWTANRRFKIIDLSTINVSTDSSLDRANVKIERGYFDLNRQSDSVLFTSDAREVVFFLFFRHFSNGRNGAITHRDKSIYLS